MKESGLFDFANFFTPERLKIAFQIGVVIFVGLITVKIISTVVWRITRKRLSPQTSMILRKGIFYFGVAIISVNVLHQLGISLAALLGAAGIIGIAIGFASQTSMSNLISGLFLISEKPFSIGDIIRVGDTVGIVMSIDLLSIKIRKFDNQFVRIPNQTLINTELTNITRFPIRRMDINLRVSFKEDLKRVHNILMELANANPYSLDEPEPLFIITGFGESGIEILFAIWFEKSDFLNLKNSIMMEIQKRFDAERIEIPFPHRTLYSGVNTEPFPVKIVEKKSREKDKNTLLKF
ncbi:MAG: mechanosensitive ion channel family protein [Spirochaetes bacterium]|nr:MAG: mechanosensitive ion channel family protein [Spirochaetota bacterium]